MIHFRFFAKYKFTDKKHTGVSIMSCILGAIAFISIVLAVILPYVTNNVQAMRYGLVCALSAVYSLCGLVLGIIGKVQRGAFDFFPKIGITVNSIVLILAGLLIYIGLA